MKTTITFLAGILLLGFGLNSCNFIKNKEITVASSTIIGECLDCEEEHSFGLKSRYGLKPIKSSVTGFSTTLNHKHPLISELIIGMNQSIHLFLMPRDTLKMQYNHLDLQNGHGSIKFQGKNAIENIVLFDLHKTLRYDDFSFFNCTETEFLDKLDVLKRKGTKIIEDYWAAHTNVVFIKYAHEFMDYTLATYLEVYPRMLKSTFSKQPPIKSERYLSQEALYDKQTPGLLNNSAYINYIERKTSNKASSIYYTGTFERTSQRFPDLSSFFLAIDSTFSEKAIIDYLEFTRLSIAIYNAENDTDEFIEKFKNDQPPSRYLDTLNFNYSKMTKTFKAGMFIPNYSFEDVNGRTRTISEFKGKILYIDLWATWCGPCKDARKHFETLANQYVDQSQDIAFISISLDKKKDRDKWKNMVIKDNYTGEQFITENAFNSPIAKDFKIASIPRFILIGKNGKIIQANAIHPGNEEINEVLTELMEAGLME